LTTTLGGLRDACHQATPPNELKGLHINLSELESPDFSKSILPALVFRLGFTTLHCAFSPIQDVRVVERGYLVSFWFRKFVFDHVLFLRLASFSNVSSVQTIVHCT
jgi:hypothetical protein